MVGLKYLSTILVLLIFILSGCSLFVAQPPAEEDKVCVSEEKLSALLTELNMSVDDLKETEPVEEETPEEEVEEETPEEEVEEETPEEEVEEETPEEEVEEETPEEETPEEEVDTTIPTRYYVEGELVKLSPQASDADGDAITFTYSEPLDENGEWQTAAGDAGEYLITVTASDGKSSTSKDLKIVITGANTPPVISGVDDLTILEGDTISFDPEITDADGDDVTVTYSGWMTESTYTTDFNDAGEYSVTITADDGKNKVEKTITVTVENINRKPVLAELESVTVKEGEIIEITAEASDPDDDELTITYSSPLDEQGMWETSTGDAGTYLVTVTASDGVDEDKETISIVVESLNQPPVIELDNVDILLQEGETLTVELAPEVTDPEDDEVDVTYSGWMTSDSKTVTEDDEGDYEVTVTASDGSLEASVTITVSVAVNHPPSFDFS